MGSTTGETPAAETAKQEAAVSHNPQQQTMSTGGDADPPAAEAEAPCRPSNEDIVAQENEIRKEQEQRDLLGEMERTRLSSPSSERACVSSTCRLQGRSPI